MGVKLTARLLNASPVTACNHPFTLRLVIILPCQFESIINTKYMYKCNIRVMDMTIELYTKHVLSRLHSTSHQIQTVQVDRVMLNEPHPVMNLINIHNL